MKDRTLATLQFIAAKEQNKKVVWCEGDHAYCYIGECAQQKMLDEDFPVSPDHYFPSEWETKSPFIVPWREYLVPIRRDYVCHGCGRQLRKHPWQITKT